MASLLLRQIERGSTSFIATETTKPITLATTLNDTSKALLFFTVNHSGASPGDYNTLGRVTSTSGIQFERYDSGGTTYIDYHVIEFTQGINVQHFYFSQASGTIDTPISTVDLNKAFPILTMTQTGGTYGANDIYSAEITSATNLRTFTGSVSASPVAVQVVQIDESETQKITGTMDTSGTAYLTVSGITENKTMWFTTVNHNAGFNFQAAYYTSYVNSTTLRHNRYVPSAGANMNYITYVVQASGVNVQNVAVTIPSGSLTTTPTFTSGILENTALSMTSMQYRMGTSSQGNDDASVNYIGLSGLTATSFVAKRNNGSFGATTTNVQVLRFNTDSSISYPKINISGNWRNVVNMYINVNSVWRNVTDYKINISGNWRTPI